MHFLDLTLPALAENLALDEALLLEAEAGGPQTLRVWEWPNLAVVLGAACRLAEDVNVGACEAEDIPILRRSSGGGTVLLGPGCLLFSVILAYDRHPALAEIQPSYRFLLGQIQQALAPLVPELEFAGTSDLAVAGRKVSGNAQQRKREHLLHHGTILYDFDVTQVERYLQMPGRQPEYRQGRGHEAFLQNLPLPVAQLKERIRSIWPGVSESADWPREKVASLVRDKYLQAEWIRRR